MRRFPSLILILLFWLGPLVAVFQGEDGSRLPACCRRHGVHHCGMDEQTAAALARAASSSDPAFAPPQHCPYFPGSMAQIPPPVAGISATQESLPVPLLQPYAATELNLAVRSLPIRPRTGRGPPVSI